MHDSATLVPEFLESTSEIIERDLLIKVRNARVITIISDEGTDINRHDNLCSCLRFCDAVSGEPNEMYISWLQLKDKGTESIFNTLVKKLQRRQVDMSVTRFVGFDGAAIFSGIHTGVAARLRGTFNRAILLIHCRAHALQLTVIAVSHSTWRHPLALERNGGTSASTFLQISVINLGTYLQRRYGRLCRSSRSPRYSFDSVDGVHSSCNGSGSRYTISRVQNHFK